MESLSADAAPPLNKCPHCGHHPLYFKKGDNFEPITDIAAMTAETLTRCFGGCGDAATWGLTQEFWAERLG